MAGKKSTKVNGTANPTDAEINAQYQHLTPEEHLDVSSMWAGSKDVIEYEMILANDKNKFSMKKCTFLCTPCSEKCLDEPIVNAYDEVLRRLQSGARSRPKPTADLTAATHSLVQNIDITFSGSEPGKDPVKGKTDTAGGLVPSKGKGAKSNVWFTIRNDGPGMPVIERDLHDGTRVWLPELLVSRALAGSNFKKHSDEPSQGPRMTVTGGCNGVGVKIANINSHRFFIQIQDTQSGRSYLQWFEDHMKVRCEPEVGTSSSSSTPSGGFTQVGFQLDLEKTGWSPQQIKQGLAFDSLRAFALTRATHIAAALGQYGVTVRFNGTAIPVRNAGDLNALLMPKPAHQMKLGDAYPWIVSISPSTDQLSGSMSILNGLAVAGGSHLNELLKQLATAIKAKLPDNRRFGPTQLAPLVFIQVLGYIENAQWDGQRKDRLTIGEDKLRPYKLPLDSMKELIQSIADQLLLQDAQKEPPKKATKTLVKEARNKYKHASNAGTKESESCVLFAAEGDSAMNTVDCGINAEWDRRKSADPKLRGSAFDYYGIFSLGGVIINARKESRARGGRSDAASIRGSDDSDESDDDDSLDTGALIRSEKLRKNAAIERLVQILGLQYSASYDSTPEGNAAFRGLRYGKFVIITDQDYDGHNIAGLVLNFFHRFWPALIKRGFVTRLVTPVIRALPKRGKDVYQFYSEIEYAEWLDKDPTRKHRFEAEFYKGLGGWSPEECGQLFEDFINRAVKFQLDKSANTSFETFYGEDTSLRKEVLRTQPLTLSAGEARKCQSVMPCTTLLRRDVQSYQLDNLNRKLPGVLDGFYESTRKAMHGLRAIYRRDGPMRKVADLATAVMSKSHYHHGNASMEGVLTRMGQRYPGSRLYPFLVSKGQFGFRNGKKPSSPRYIRGKLNVQLAEALFPPADDHLLQYVIVEGRPAEPVTFVPTLPLAIMEGLQLPATGWTIQKWPVRLEDVAHNLRKLLTDPTSDLRKFKMELRQFPTVEHLHVQNKKAEAELLVGQFTREGPLKIRITELPPTVATLAYIRRHLDRLEEVASVNDLSNTSTETINIEVTFNKGTSLDDIETKYKRAGFTKVPGLSWYLGLVLTVHHQLNFMGVDGTVRSFECYEELFREWFESRRELYTRRLDRQTILYEIELVILRAQLRYAELLSKMKLERRPKSEMEDLLDGKKFQRVHIKAFNRPGGIATEDLRRVILETGYGVDTDDDDEDDIIENEFKIPKGKPSFDYLLRKSMLDLTKESETKIEARITHIESLLAEIREDTKPFRGAKVWRKEVDAALNIIRDGIARNWANKEELSYTVKTV